MTWLENLHFMRPEFFLALLPLALLFALSWRIGGNKSGWHKLIDAQLMPYLFTGTTAKHNRAPFYILALAWLLASIALAGPSWQQLPSPVYEKDDVLVIVLDNTPSMLAQDSKPSRATHAAREINDILLQRKEGRTALITYSEDAFIVSPLTRDTNTISLLAQSLSPEMMPAIGNRPLAAIELALGLVSQYSNASILWITDAVPESESKDIINAINNSSANLSIMGIGSTSGAPIPLPNGNGFVKDASGSLVVPRLNRSELKSIARASNGKYSDSLINDDDINYLLSNLSLETNEATEISDVKFDQWRDESWLIAFILLIPAAFAFRQGGLFSLLLLAPLLHSPQAQANWFDDMWQTKNQQAQTAFNAGDTKTAENLFENEQWRGSAAYKNGEYETAIKHFENAQTPTDWYNYGNALAKNNKLEEAIAAYDKAIAQNTNFDDAIANKALLEELLKQQQEQEQNQDGEQENEDQQDGDEQQEGDQSQQDQQGDDEQSDQNQEGDQQQDSDSEQQPGENSEQESDPNESEQEESEQEGSDGEQTEEERKAEQEQQAAEEAAKEQAEQEQQAAQAAEAGEEDGEPRPALPAQLRNIEDNPGGLLKNKFADQASKRQRSSTGEQRW